LTYTFIGTAFGGKDNGEKFLRIVKDLEQEEDRYTLVRGNFSKFKSSIIRNFVEMFDKDGAEKEFIKYLSKDSKYLEVANLIQALELGTFEVTGGNTPKVFIRINEPAKLEALVKGNKYSNSFLSSIEKAGKKADSVLEDFFTNKRSNEERWDFIERYFLGKI
jgi:ATP-dependent DNA helicase RecQ